MVCSPLEGIVSWANELERTAEQGENGSDSGDEGTDGIDEAGETT